MSLEEAIFTGGLREDVPSRDRRREMDWITQNCAQYANQWVVVEGDRLIAADADGHKAFTAAKAAGVEVPFLIHVLPERSAAVSHGLVMALSIDLRLPGDMPPRVESRSRLNSPLERAR